MRIVKLTPTIEKRLLARRMQRDEEAHAIASEIVMNVRKRGDSVETLAEAEGLLAHRNAVRVRR